MKVIERVIESEGSPTQRNDLWIHNEEHGATLNHWHNGKWEPILGGGEGPSEDPNAVKFTPQSLTDAQQSQARENIGLGAVAYMGDVVGTVN